MSGAGERLAEVVGELHLVQRRQRLARRQRDAVAPRLEEAKFADRPQAGQDAVVREELRGAQRQLVQEAAPEAVRGVLRGRLAAEDALERGGPGVPISFEQFAGPPLGLDQVSPVQRRTADLDADELGPVGVAGVAPILEPVGVDEADGVVFGVLADVVEEGVFRRHDSYSGSHRPSVTTRPPAGFCMI